MPRLFRHFIFILFSITALSGVWMRLTPFYDLGFIPYENILQGHSHVAILGWMFTGILLVFLCVIWKSIERKKEAIRLMVTLFILSLAIFVSFLYQGYGTIAIILSTLHILVEYWTAWFIYHEIKQQKQLPKTARLYINGGLMSLVVSSFGPLFLGIITLLGIKDQPIYDMAIYFYLHFQYNGWLYFMLIGLFIIILQRKQIPFRERLLANGFCFYIIALIPSYFLSILWHTTSTISHVFALLGGIGQWIGVLFIIITFREIWVRLYRKFHEITIVSLWITFFLLMVKSTMELGLIAPVMADLVYRTPSIITGYLYFTLLGFVSIFILTQLQLTGFLRANAKSVQTGYITFITGFFINVFFLFGDGFAKWCGFSGLPYQKIGLLISSIIVLLGILIIWLFSTPPKTQQLKNMENNT